MKEQMESFAFWGYKELGISGKELSRYLGILQSSLSEAIERGEGNKWGQIFICHLTILQFIKQMTNEDATPNPTIKS